jgi:hypothetical protein
MITKFGCKKKSYRKNNDDKIIVEILRLRLIIRTESAPKRGVAGSCKRSVTSYRTVRCHVQLADYILTAVRILPLIQYCIRPSFESCKRSPIEQTRSSIVHTRLGRNQAHSLSSANIISQITKTIRKPYNVRRHKNI